MPEQQRPPQPNQGETANPEQAPRPRAIVGQPDAETATGTMSASPTPHGDATPKTEPRENPSAERDWSQILPDKWTDWLLALFTGALALFTWQLVDATHKLWEAGERQIKAAETAAIAATRANDLVRETFISAERPWVSVDAIPISIFYNVNGMNVSINFILKNTGKSPASLASIHPEIQAPAVGIEQEFNPLTMHSSRSLEIHHATNRIRCPGRLRLRGL